MPKFNLTFSERRMAALRTQAQMLDLDLAGVLRLGQDVLDEVLRAYLLGGEIAFVDRLGTAKTIRIPGLARATEQSVAQSLADPSKATRGPSRALSRPHDEAIE